MIFNSIAFLIFLPIVFILYWFVFNRNLKWQNVLLLVASYFFYGWWSWKFLGLLALSTLLDYFYGFGVAAENPRKSKFFLWLSVVNNLGILALFKYYDFFAKEFSGGLNQIGFHVEPYLLNLALPIGISFYTFHGMSYIFDINRKKQEPVRNIVDYSVFVSFFPLLVAGPIERASHLLPQVQRKRIFKEEVATVGLNLILWGLFKKVVVADNLAPAVNDIFSSYLTESGITLLLGAIYFSFQIYCDFSGYSDIARGVAKLFGFELLLNFNNPYISKSIPEFWKRWHLSLSSWFRDYVYIPLGGSRNGVVIAVRNVFIIFFLSGFWHGANWTFLVWGSLHALFFIPSFITKVRRNLETKKIEESVRSIKDFGSIALTYSIVTFSWIFFRSENMSGALRYLIGIFQNDYSSGSILSWRSNSTEGSHLEFLFILGLFLIVHFWNSLKITPLKLSFLLLITLFFGNFRNPSDFIYFQF